MINYDFGNKLEKDYQANINIYKKNRVSYFPSDRNSSTKIIFIITPYNLIIQSNLKFFSILIKSIMCVLSLVTPSLSEL